MLAPPESDVMTMLRALGYSRGAIGAIAEADLFRSQQDRDFFSAELTALDVLLDDLSAAQAAAMRKDIRDRQRLRARTTLGDVVLDQAVRDAKQDMRRGLRTTSKPDGADYVFPSDITQITNAERRLEPVKVKELVARFGQVPDFPGKSAIAEKLMAAADNQLRYFAERDAGELEGTAIDSGLRTKIRAASDHLYSLHKRCLARFPRQTKFVAGLFFDVARPRKKPGVAVTTVIIPSSDATPSATPFAGLPAADAAPRTPAS